jgi:hypothetical protein
LPRPPGLIWRRQVFSGRAIFWEASDETAENAKLVLARPDLMVQPVQGGWVLSLYF